MDNSFQDIHSWVEQERKKSGVPGLIICARDDSGILFHETYGVHDLKTQQPLKKDALVPIASQTKTLTVAATLKLCEEGALCLEDKLIHHLPNLETLAASNVALQTTTIRQALQHQTSLAWRPGMFDDWDIGLRPYPTADGLRRRGIVNMFDRSMLADGNRSFNYSNAAYSLMGAIIEKKSGMPYGEYIMRHLLEPHGLKDVHPNLSAEEITNRRDIPTGYYDKIDSANNPSIRPVLAGVVPAGGAYATASGISSFYHMLLSGKILSDKSLQEMTSFSQETHEGSHWGMGLNKQSNRAGNLIGHYGAINGYQGWTVHNDALKLTVSAFSTSFTPPNVYEPNRRPSEKGLVFGYVQHLCEAVADHKATIEVPYYPVAMNRGPSKPAPR